jgi:tellurite resistance protein
MTNTAIRRTTSALVAALFLAVGAAVSIAPAHADPAYDQQFIDFLDQKGVPYKNRTDVIRTAKQFCLDFSRQGGSAWKAAYHLMKQEGWTQTQAENFVQAAVPVYCSSA